MQKPLVCFITYNRLGASALNLKAILNTKSNFELVIVDNASTDGIWEFVEQLKDERIKIKHRFNKNYGVVCAANYGLSKRKKNQAFILVENDIFIDDENWIEKFEKTLLEFPHLGMIGAVTRKYLNERMIEHPAIYIEQLLKDKKLNKNKLILIPETINKTTIYYRPNLIGSCLYLTPEVLDLIGYWNEESGGADNEIGKRINLFTPYYTAMTTEFFTIGRPTVNCSECIAKKYCKYNQEINSDCYLQYKKKLKSINYHGDSLLEKSNQLINDIKCVKRPVYSASIHDAESMINNFYDLESAIKNFRFFQYFEINK